MRVYLILILIWPLWFPSTAFGGPDGLPASWYLPHWLNDALVKAKVATSPETRDGAGYTVSLRLNPFYLQGDFDGDCKADAAVLVEERASGKAGIAIVRRASPSVVILGAGHKFTWGGDDFKAMDVWRGYPKARVAAGPETGPPPTLKGDAIYAEKSESASGLIYFDGRSYLWYQLSD